MGLVHFFLLMKGTSSLAEFETTLRKKMHFKTFVQWYDEDNSLFVCLHFLDILHQVVTSIEFACLLYVEIGVKRT